LEYHLIYDKAKVEIKVLEDDMHPDWKRICTEFMEATSYTENNFDEWWTDRHYDRENRPETYLQYPDAPQVPLGKPIRQPVADFWTILENRRSKRNFTRQPLLFNDLNLLLWASQGITADLGDYQLRTAPSSGALYPIETYIIVNNVQDLNPGLYHLNVKEWSLESLKTGDLCAQGHRVLRGQSMTKDSAINIIWTAVMERCRAKYYERAYRYVWWDSAAIGENFLLAAEALGLGASLMGSWYDDLAHEFLGIDGKDHFSVLTAACGKIEGNDWKKDRRPPN
jgi:SagB-type dehydrogenase family enzyme